MEASLFSVNLQQLRSRNLRILEHCLQAAGEVLDKTCTFFRRSIWTYLLQYEKSLPSLKPYRLYL